LNNKLVDAKLRLEHKEASEIRVIFLCPLNHLVERLEGDFNSNVRVILLGNNLLVFLEHFLGLPLLVHHCFESLVDVVVVLDNLRQNESVAHLLQNLQVSRSLYNFRIVHCVKAHE
jgi:hypothetical protein